MSGAGADADVAARRRAIGATIVPEHRVGGRRPDERFLARYPPAGLIVYGRALGDGRTLAGLADEIVELRARCDALGLARPFLCCDLEEGAGLHFDDATRLPPALALAAADAGGAPAGVDWIASAGALCGHEARARGVELVLGPVVDVNTRADNPIIAVRSFGDEPGAVAERALRFTAGLHLGGAGACLKHWPGHGDTDLDSHLVLPRVERSAAELEATELVPYARAFAAGALERPDSVMVAHLDVPALTGERGLPTTLSRRATAERLAALGFDGAALSDGMNMGAVRVLERTHARAVRAGCHGLLCPVDPHEAAIEIFEGAEDAGRADGASWLDVERAARRMERLRASLAARRAASDAQLAERGVHPGARPGAGAAERARFAAELAAACLCADPSGLPVEPLASWELAPFGLGPVARDEARAALEAALGAGSSARARAGGAGVALVAAVACRVAAGRGRAGLEPDEERALAERIGAARAAGRPVTVLWLGSPQVLGTGPWAGPDVARLIAFAPTPPLIAAAAAVLAGERRAGGSLPVRRG